MAIIRGIPRYTSFADPYLDTKACIFFRCEQMLIHIPYIFPSTNSGTETLLLLNVKNTPALLKQKKLKLIHIHWDLPNKATHRPRS